MNAHGIMFHHFYNAFHPKGQGAICAEELELILRYYAEKYHIIRADEWADKFNRGTLTEKDVCLTFDDGLKCQYDVALPVLEKFDLTAFWFVYTTPLLGIPERLEIYRHFRTICFRSTEDFYSVFFQKAKKMFPKIDVCLASLNLDHYLSAFPFYTKDDKIFRYTRDYILREKNYNDVMDQLLEDFNYNVKEQAKSLWMDRHDLINLYQSGHIIGLHSHSHPTVMASLSKKEQYDEYAENQRILEDMLGISVFSASYPCNSYNDDTLEVMKELHIQFAFCANTENMNGSCYEFPREDHINIINKIAQKGICL